MANGTLAVVIALGPHRPLLLSWSVTPTRAELRMNQFRTGVPTEREMEMRAPNDMLIPVARLRVGDMVDLAGDNYAGPEPRSTSRSSSSM